VVALGIGIDGTKHPLALVEGSSEYATLVRDLLVGLRRARPRRNAPDPGGPERVGGPVQGGTGGVRQAGHPTLPGTAQEDPLGPVEELLGRYRDYLLAERPGRRDGTRLRGRRAALRRSRRCGDALDWFGLPACPGRAVGSAKLIVCALRSRLRWLHLTGAVPGIADGGRSVGGGWRLPGLPKGLEPGQLRRLLAICDRRTPTGRCDYAILLLLSRLGRRAGEVAMLGLDDIDWRRGRNLRAGQEQPRRTAPCRPTWVRRSRHVCGGSTGHYRRAQRVRPGCVRRIGR
jgi:integrase